MYCRLIDGSLVTLSKARYARTDPQVLSTHHVPLTDLNGAIPLGLDWQTWTISGVIADPQSVRWHDIIWLSLDNVSWRACRVQATAFPTNNYQQSTYELTMLVSPILEGAAVRYPTTGYKFGNQSITGISQVGNVSAYPTIHFLAPLFYAPLNNTLIDFTGQAVTFTRTGAKAHGGVTYPVNTPIFDSGLYLASDTAQDTATWTPPASTLKTIAMQIKKTNVAGGDTLTIWTAIYNRLTINVAAGTISWTDDTTTVTATFPSAAWDAGTVIDVVVIDGESNAITLAVHAIGGAWEVHTGTLDVYWAQSLPLGNLEGSIANLICYPYALTSTEYQAIVYSSLPLQWNTLQWNTLYIGNRYAGEIVKGSDSRLVNANGSDISALLGGVDTPIGSAAVTIEQSQGLSARWYVEVKRTDV